MTSFGALFDWDGVIVDSAALHERSWELLAAEEKRGLPDDHFKRGFGQKNEVIIPKILEWTQDDSQIRRLSLRKEALYREILLERGMEPLRGVRELLQTLRKRGIPCAVGSSTHRENIEAIFDLAELRPYFKAVVTSEDVKHGKPDPEVFLKAGQALGMPADRCVVFEDALVGIEAAHRGGMKCIAVATTNPIDRLRHADLAVPSLSDVSFEAIEKLFSC